MQDNLNNRISNETDRPNNDSVSDQLTTPKATRNGEEGTGADTAMQFPCQSMKKTSSENDVAQIDVLPDGDQPGKGVFLGNDGLEGRHFQSQAVLQQATQSVHRNLRNKDGIDSNLVGSRGLCSAATLRRCLVWALTC